MTMLANSKRERKYIAQASMVAGSCVGTAIAALPSTRAAGRRLVLERLADGRVVGCGQVRRHRCAERLFAIHCRVRAKVNHRCARPQSGPDRKPMRLLPPPTARPGEQKKLPLCWSPA